MSFDNDLVAAKLRRWDRYLNRYRLPAWEEIPDIGLYMEQVVTLLRGYLDYLPPELKEEEAVTAAAINNYVRTRAMPGPIKKRYYRVHLAYLIMICTLKQGLSISLVQRLIPSDLTEEELQPFYTEYVERHSLAACYFTQEVRAACATILKHVDEEPTMLDTDRVEEIIATAAVIGGFSRLLAEKLLLLEGHTVEDGGNLDLIP
ncbi:MAG TPA: hypothetical protein DCP22_05470 [Ruminococcaceae bacterium]|nr:hypothetical protein [Oscillospiraceae bacterium]